MNPSTSVHIGSDPNTSIYISRVDAKRRRIPSAFEARRTPGLFRPMVVERGRLGLISPGSQLM